MASNHNQTWNLQERLQKYPGYRAEHTTLFANRQVTDYNPEIGISNPVGTAYALRCDYDEDEKATDKLMQLQQDPQVDKLEALVIGTWEGEMAGGSSSFLIEALVGAKDWFPSLKALFIGDIHYSECEISWIVQSDISPILEAYPNLEILQVRGGDGLAFTPFVGHENLKALIVETGGLSSATIAQICALDLPKLQHLELWLGSDNYGGNSSIADFNPILVERKFPNLIYLGLRNSEYSDDIAEAVVRSPLLNTIRILDLSMGTLSDAGAELLLKNPVVQQLDTFNIAENYLSDEILAFVEEQQANFPVQIIIDGQKKDEYEDEEYRYCSVAE
ncbi:STM4015 family protein [Dendronalium sp. ChiSLP03b]|uniref:STM4015 family protein n=1 Tax=Dendronalium sp. ChiSLP03b TaxID=3075381 RepID=UPI002AD56E66|nr:STM4015 family protein [Dendronalium sp. ChiSLP03b]MDZ8209082.1 STM4015 family protein [Dendronalium sp. ChiSLP03b]